MKELRRIKPPLVYFLRFSRRKATSSTSNFFAETQVFFSDILLRAAPRANGPTGQAVLRGRRSYGTVGPTGQTVHPGQAWMVLGAFVFLILDDSGYDAFRKFELIDSTSS